MSGKNQVQQVHVVDGGNKDLSGGTNPTSHIYSADQTFKQSSSAYGVVGASIGPQSQGHTQSTVIPASVPTNTGLSMATGQNNFQQHPVQYNSVILNSTSSVSQANQKNSNNTFGLGQINIRNKIIKPPAPAQQLMAPNEYNNTYLPNDLQEFDGMELNLRETTSNIQMINSKSTVSAASRAGQDNVQDGGQFADGDMDMDNVVHVEEQQDYSVGQEFDEDGHERMENDGESIVYGGGEGAYVNLVVNHGAHPDGHLPQSHAFSLAQDLSVVGSGPAGPTTMHSLQLVDLTEMTDEAPEEGQQ